VLVDDNGGTLTKYINSDGIDNKLRQTTGANVQYFLTDHLGNTNALTDPSGNLTSSASYDSFGNATGNINTRYQFTGREFDNFTGLQRFLKLNRKVKVRFIISRLPKITTILSAKKKISCLSMMGKTI
jgi:RHS protein